jgi:L-rhamnose mutarotase
MDGRGVRRVGQVIRIRPERIEEYERLHAEPWQGALATLRGANVRNYSIFRHGELLFAYFEYVGDDYAADMARIAADPVTQDWWKLTDAMQEPLAGRAPGEWWLSIPEVFHTD